MFMTRKLGRLVLPVLVAIAVPALATGPSAAATSRSKPAHRTTAKSTAKPRARSAAKAAVAAAVPKSPVTISITSRIRHGNLVVSLNGVPVFNEEFEKPIYLISQTTTWDPVPVAVGKHRLTAKVQGRNGKTYLSETYDLELTNGIELRVRMKGGKLMIEPAS